MRAFSLEVMPAGMSVDPHTGIVVWTPTIGEVGSQPVLLRVTDEHGATDLQPFDVSVAAPNEIPVITSTAPGQATAEEPYQYLVTAQDSDNAPLTYHLDSTPIDNMNLDANTGSFTWTPTDAEAGTTVTVRLHVDDGRGGTAAQTIAIQVAAAAAPNQDPLITSTPRTAVQIGQRYVYLVVASDADGDPLTYSLPTAPAGMSITAAGAVTWTPSPTQAQFGANAVEVRVDDGRGGFALKDFSVDVVTTQTNDPPEITSAPPLDATAGQAYVYNMTGDDPDGDVLDWHLVGGPVGLSVDPLLGALRWTPAPGQVGSQDVHVQLIDSAGTAAPQDWTIMVRGANLPPHITSNPPPTLAGVGQEYTYPVAASDPDGDPVNFRLLSYPAGMSIDSTGSITWTAAASGTYPVTVQVDDGQGLTDSQTFSIAVSDTNYQPPVIGTQTPPSQYVAVGQLYTYQVQASDPNGQGLIYSLANPSGDMHIDANGLVTWTPGPNEKPGQTLQVVVTDTAGLAAEQDTPINVVAANDPPVINSTPVATATAGAYYEYDVNASDADNDPLSYALTTASGAPLPQGLSIDQNGIISWQTAAADIGTLHLVVTVTDPFGAAATQPYDLTVGAETTPPQVDVEITGNNPLNIGATETFMLLTSDEVGVVQQTLTLKNNDTGAVTNIPVDGTGQATLRLTTPGHYTVTGTATNPAGITATATHQLRVLDPNVNAPQITLPAPNGGNAITAPTAVAATITGDSSLTWQLEVVSSDGTIDNVIASGSGPVNGTIATFDPTMLPNDSYTLRVSASDAGGDSEQDAQVQVEGNLKLGDFSLSFTDLTIPVAGIPITITRTYNTLNANQNGDFGYGWTLSYGDAKLQVNLADGADAGWGGYPAFLDGTRVYVTMPDGSRQGFTFAPYEVSEDDLGLINYWHPYFRPDAGNTYTLTVPDLLLDKDPDSGEYTYTTDDGELETYNPQNPVLGNQYTLTNPQGIASTIDATTGQLLTISNRNGTTLTFSDTGISSNRGVQVTFTRDPGARIIGITDPAGHSLAYSYDANGNLATFTDRLGNVTTFLYRTDVAHYLEQVNDPLGRAAVQTTYYPDGRVMQATDASGKTIHYSYNTNTLIQLVTDQMGNTTEIDQDSLGNVIRQVTPNGVITVNQYSDPNNPTLVTSQTTVNANLTTSYTYDANGNLTSTTAPDGTVARTYYDSFGEPISQVDVAGNPTNNTYDGSGNLVQVTAPNGTVTSFAHDDNSDLTQATNTDNQVLVTNVYDSSGDVTESTPAAGQATNFANDADGNQIATWYFNGTGTSQVQVLDLTFYDADGQTTGTERAVLPQGQFITSNFANANIPSQFVSWTTSTTYDGDGKVLTTTNEQALETQNTYDERGELVQVRQQSIDQNGNVVWLDTRTAFDADGQIIAETEQYQENTTAPIHGTITVYDVDGNVTETDQVVGLVISLTGSGGSIQSVLTSSGTVVSSTTSTYDSSDREATSTDENGLHTQTIYDVNGNVIRTRQQSVDQNGNLVWLDTDTVYDSLDRVSLTTDEYVEGSSIPMYATMTQYDTLGREVASVRLMGVQVTIANDVSTLTNPGTQLWETQTVYDSEGRVSESIAADGQVTDYAYDNLGRKTAVIGEPESLADAGLTPQDVGLTNGAGVTVRLRTETTYDPVTGNVQSATTNIREVILADGTVQLLPIDYAAAQTTAYQYDAFDNLINTTYEDGTSTSSTYDAFGNKTSDTNKLGQTTTYQYDTDNRLVKVILPAVLNPATGQMQQPIYQYAYDALGNQTLIQDPLGRQTVFTFDDQGNELTRTLPLGASNPGTWTESFEYDACGREILHISFEGVVTQYIYDSRTGLLVQERFFDSVADYNNGQGTPNEVRTVVYDAFGRQVQLTQTPAGGTASVTQQSYDGEGRLTSIISPQGTLTYTYDNLGRRTATIVGTLVNPLRIESYTYDALGRLKTVDDNLTPGATPNTVLVTSYEYDLLGDVLETNLPNGTFDVSAYNTMNQLTSMIEYAPGGASELAQYDYTLRADGTNASLDETFWTTAGTLNNNYTWTYDSLDRLGKEALVSSDSNRSYTATYTYDLVGNRVLYSLNVPSNSALDGTVTSTYDANDRLLHDVSTLGTTTTYGYDQTQETSQVVAQSNGSSVNTTFTYDLPGNVMTATVDARASSGALVSREMLTYDYAATGIRVSALDQMDSNGDGTWDQQTLAEYLNDPENFTGYSQVLRQTQSDTTTGQVSQVIDYTIGLDGIAQTTTAYINGQIASSVTYVFGHDGHGSVRVLTDMTAAIAQIFMYDAFGNMLAIHNGAGQFIGSNAANALTTFLYGGQQYDAKTGMQYLRARYYNPVTGTFNQLDPYSGDAKNPQTFNKYLFTHGDPVNFVDPTGRDGLCEVMVSMASFASNVGTQIASSSSIYVRVIGGAIYGAVVGGILGFGLGYLDGLVASKYDFDYALKSAKESAIMGAGLGAAFGIAMGFLSPKALFIIGTIINLALTGLGVYDAVQAGNPSLVLFRAGLGLLFFGIAARGPARRGSCFPAGTPVATAIGLKNIENLTPADEVWAFDHKDLVWRLRKVLQTFTHNHEGLMVTVEAREEKIEATGGHPFWVIRGKGLEGRPLPELIPARERGGRQEGRWVLAKDLRVGDELLSRSGQIVSICAVSAENRELLVYNIHVEELENYAVGVEGFLVHNTNDGSIPPELAARLRQVENLPPWDPNRMAVVREANEILARRMIGNGPLDGEAVPPPANAPGGMNNAEARAAAAELGWREAANPGFDSHGELMFTDGSNFYSPDNTTHIGGVWKRINRQGVRTATLDADLNVIGP